VLETAPREVSCVIDAANRVPTATTARAAREFAGSLTPAQRALLDLPLTRANAVKWSNLPVPAVPRVGVRIGDLDAAQQQLARALVASATSSCGLKMFDDIRLADDYISPIVPMFGWTSKNYYIAFLGTPSPRSPWMLKVGGHHLAYNFTYNGRMPGATPLFNGTEPIRFSAGGVVHEPMSAQSEAMSGLAGAIASYPDARLAGRFTDVVKGVEVTLFPDKPPVGGNDTGFPSPYPTGTLGRGVPYARLNAAQQALVRRAIATYTSLPGAALSNPLLASYLQPANLAQTYIGFAGAPDLNLDGSYVRIDGPRVWMEFVVQPGVAYPKQLHYHALWRDRLADYGGQFAR
jgi:hypothetical protein